MSGQELTDALKASIAEPELKPLEVFTSSDGFVSIYERGTEVRHASVVGFCLQGPTRTVAMEVSSDYAGIMAASVDMYEALKMARYCIGGDADSAGHPVLEAIDAVIEKAGRA